MFRFDRAVTLGLIQPVLRAVSAGPKRRIPILMYHSIREGVGRNHPYFETNTSSEVFTCHLRFLRKNGYKALDLGGALDALLSGGEVGRRVVITFDDGYRDFYTHAFPRLMEYGFQASLFVVSGLTAEHRTSTGDKDYLTWSELRELHAGGTQIGSHTVTHPELYRLSARRIEDEIRQSKENIEDKLGTRVKSFAYPFAFPEQDRRFRATLRGFLEKNGYENGVSTIIGTAGGDDDLFFLPRLPMNSYDDIQFLQAKLEGSYDWLHLPQQIYKRLKRGVRPFGRVAASETPEDEPARSLLGS